MKRHITRRLSDRQHRLSRRLRKASRADNGPTLPTTKITYDLAERTRAIAHGGLGAVIEVANRLKLAAVIDAAVKVLKVHRPYHESDHVLNIAYNILCGGRALDDIERLRNDEVHLDALGVETIPDPTTAGDFCRRFDEKLIEALQDALNTCRRKVWALQGPAFTGEVARIDVDGSIIPTTGECKQGMGMSYKGIWGYLGLLVSLANTREPLFVRMLPGNASPLGVTGGYLDRAIALARDAGFSEILLRGDTEFAQTKHFDRWDAEGVGFIFGYSAMANMKAEANALEEGDYAELERRAKRAFVAEDKRRARQLRVKEALVKQHGYKNLILKSEDIAEFDYRPRACKRSYRVVVLRKNITVERGETALFDEIRYFFYITNQREMPAAQVVFEANDRCNQENLIAQLKDGGVRALHAPLNTLDANWAYMVMAALAWSLKAWTALSLPITGRWRRKHVAERDRWLRMELRTFLAVVINVPAQIVRSGRRRIFRLLAWRPGLPALFRLLAAP